MKPIKETVKQLGQYLIKYEDDSVSQSSKIVTGLAWPTAEKHGYFCVLADKLGEPVNPGVEHRPVEIIAEEEHTLLPALFDGLAAQVKKCCCTVVYAQYNPAVVYKPGTDGTNKAFVVALNDYKTKRPGLALFSLQPALITDWLVGILSVQKWQQEKALSVPNETIMYSQLKSMTNEDRKQTEQDRFPAMMALICAMTPFIQPAKICGGLRRVVRGNYVW